MINSKGFEKLNDVWIVEDFSLKIMTDIVGFVYCDAITFEDADHAMELVEAADRYRLADLLDDCSKYLGAELNEHNVLALLLLSDTYDLSALKDKCLKLIPEALKTRRMKDMPGYDEYMKYNGRAELLETCLEQVCDIRVNL
ncbi:Protein maternal effect lethal 26 [Halotydeus destructor]|nr:Protein maternal effect lethal 26 [Halotydeus destructor]